MSVTIIDTKDINMIRNRLMNLKTTFKLKDPHMHMYTCVHTHTHYNNIPISDLTCSGGNLIGYFYL